VQLGSSAFAVVRVAAGATFSITSTAPGGSVTVLVDVAGWFAAGVPATAGSAVTLPSARVARTTIASHGAVTFHLAGRSGVPLRNVRAAIVTLTSVAPGAAGSLTAWASGTTRPSTAALQFRTGEAVTVAELVNVSTTSAINVYNSSSRSLQVAVSVSGYARADTPTVPATQPGRYTRNFTGVPATDQATFHSEGVADAGKTFVLLDIGAQANDMKGVVPTNQSIEISYGDLVADLNAYLAGFGNATSQATVAVGTNNDANDWTNYSGTKRGQDWANLVIEQLTPGTNVTVVGADDIEANFFSTEAQASAWVNGYLGATSGNLVINGSADGCPSTYGATSACQYGWTLAQYYSLASRSGRVRVLPQIYNAAQAVQWANIDRAGGGGLVFAGALTEHGADPTTFTPAQGWTALRTSISTVVIGPSIPRVVDLHIDS
jgi:hypothetical protein